MRFHGIVDVCFPLAFETGSDLYPTNRGGTDYKLRPDNCSSGNRQIKPARIGGAQPLHASGQIDFFCAKQHMIMVVHQNVYKDIAIKPLGLLTDGV